MTRRFNYTGRIGLTSEHVSGRIANKSPLTAEIVLNLKGLGLDDGAAVVVEPYHGTISKRFTCGTVGDTPQKVSLDVSELNLSGGLRLRVKVVGPGGTLLASRERAALISDADEEGLQSLLPVSPDSIGERVWELDVDTNERPLIRYNARLTSFETRLATDPMFQGAILPVVLSKIFKVLLESADEGGWQEDWLVFAQKLGMPIDPLPNPSDADKSKEWVDEVSRRAVSKLACVTRYVAAEDGE